VRLVAVDQTPLSSLTLRTVLARLVPPARRLKRNVPSGTRECGLNPSACAVMRHVLSQRGRAALWPHIPLNGLEVKRYFFLVVGQEWLRRDAFPPRMHRIWIKLVRRRRAGL